MISYPDNSILVPAKLIYLDDERRPIDDDHVRSLAEEISETQLNSLPTVLDMREPGSYPEMREYYKLAFDFACYFLVAGAHRVCAMRDYLEEELIPVAVFSGPMFPSRKMQLEYSENNKRLDESWQTKVQGIAKIHQQLVREGRDRGDKWSLLATGGVLGLSKGNVSINVQLAEALKDKQSPLWMCDTATSAYNLLLKGSQDALVKEKMRRSKEQREAAIDPIVLAKERAPQLGMHPADFVEKIGTKSMPVTPATPAPTNHRVDLGLYHEDCRETMAKLQANYFDGIFTDPMYGVDARSISNRNHTFLNKFKQFQEKGMQFKEIELLMDCLPDFFRILKPNAWFCFYYDLEHHEKLYMACEAAGFKVQRWPQLWIKTHACRNDAARFNTTKNYEPIMVCRKGDALLQTAVPRSTFAASREACDFVKANKDHPFVKPYDAWKNIVEPRLLPGSIIYEPFAGRGSLLHYAYANGINVIASEQEEDHFHYLCNNVEQWQTNAKSTPTSASETSTDSSGTEELKK